MKYFIRPLHQCFHINSALCLPDPTITKRSFHLDWMKAFWFNRKRCIEWFNRALNLICHTKDENLPDKYLVLLETPLKLEAREQYYTQ